MNFRYQTYKLRLADCFNVDQVVNLIHAYLKHGDLDLHEQVNLIKQMDLINTNYFISIVNRERLHQVIDTMDKWHDAWSVISKEYPDVEYFGKKPEIRSMMELVK